MNGTNNNGCVYYQAVIADIETLGPLVSIFTSAAPGVDTGTIWDENFGDLSSYQHSGLALTLLNLTAWPIFEGILKTTANPTASATPCNHQLFCHTSLL